VSGDIRDTVIIVAGGTGRRMGGGLPKQFLLLDGVPVLWRTLQAFHRYDPSLELIVVIHPAWQEHWQRLAATLSPSLAYRLTTGGETRFHSVQRGLALARDEGLIAVHDASRPLVSPALLDRLFGAARRHGNAVPAVAVTDSLREITGDTSRPADRERFRAIQTPQIFPAKTLKEAFRQDYRPAFTDEATVVETLGTTIHLVEGERENIKITTPFDLKVATLLLKEREQKNLAQTS